MQKSMSARSQTNIGPHLSRVSKNAHFIVIGEIVLLVLLGLVFMVLLTSYWVKNKLGIAAFSLPTNQKAGNKGSCATGVVTNERDSTMMWKFYGPTIHGISFKYPSTWFGPEAYPKDDPSYISVGTSPPHKFGEDRILDLPTKDSYFVTFQVLHYNLSTQLFETEPWIKDYNQIFRLRPGQEIVDHLQKKTKIRELIVAGRRAAEISIGNIDSNGSNDYSERQIIIRDPRFIITITGGPVIVSTMDSQEVRSKTVASNQSYKNIFEQVVCTVQFGNDSNVKRYDKVK